MSTKCFTFYSYKGGSGRTTTLVNTAKHLIEQMGVSKKHPLLIVDVDLESAGLTYLFECENRFTDLFGTTTHTEKVLTESSDSFKWPNGNYLLGDDAGRGYVFGDDNRDSDICKAIRKALKDLYTRTDVDALLNGVEMKEPDLVIFEEIIRAHKWRETRDDLDDETKAKYERLCETYNLLALIEGLTAIHNKGGDRCTEEKRKMILDFLPTRRFVDVSKYFGCEAEHVLFLGVDVAYVGQKAPNDSADPLMDLKDLCEERSGGEYRAILFDSGSGVQSTAHVLHQVSDTIVYCMRPTQQFIAGTSKQLLNYGATLRRVKEEKADVKKPVVLLPTAVPHPDESTEALQQNSFGEIKKLATKLNSDIVDDIFCNETNCLREVSLFKWHEHILGTKSVHSKLDNGMREIIDKYADFDSMPDDAKNAYKVYAMLAERLIENTRSDGAETGDKNAEDTQNA